MDSSRNNENKLSMVPREGIEPSHLAVRDFEITPLLDRFLDHYVTFQGRSTATAKSIKISINAFIRHNRVKSVLDVNQMVLEDWVIHKKKSGDWNNTTVRLNLMYMEIFFKWLVQRGFVDENPCSTIPKPRPERGIPKALSKEKAQLVLDTAKSYPYKSEVEKRRAVAMIALMIYTGVRLKELMTLKICDVSFSEKSVLIKQAKGGKDRLIPLSRKLAIYLQDYLVSRRDKRTPFFFCALRGDKRLHKHAVVWSLNKIQDVVGFNIHAHMFRHTFATLMLEGGCDLFALSKMMGHSDIKTTTIYLSATTHHLKGQIDKHPL